VQAIEDIVRGSSLPILVAAHQLESVGLRFHFDIPKNIPIFQPMVDDAKPMDAWQLLQDSKEGKHVRMRDVFPPYNLTVETLMGIKLKKLPHLNGGPRRTSLISSISESCTRKVFTHIWFPPCFPFQTSTDPVALYGSLPLNATPDGWHDLGRTPCERENSHRILVQRFLDSGFTVGDEKA